MTRRYPKPGSCACSTTSATGFPPQRLITSLADFDRYPANEVIALYNERWEIELGYDSPGAIPRHLRELRKQIKLFVLPPRRSGRSYPRAVKVKTSSYPKKRRTAPDERLTHRKAAK